MKTDKEIKKDFIKMAAENPEKYYPLTTLKSLNFKRKKCSKCSHYFWTLSDDSFCGDSSCTAGYSFIGKKTKPMDYLSSWTEFKKFFSKKNYLSVKPYPVVSRWRQDSYWVGASVYPFQPHVVEGNSKPPSNAVIIPQPCLRFNDIDNVGLTGAHYSCFDMFGQLHFESPSNYKPQLYFDEYFEWLTKIMKVPIQSLKIHEEGWAGAGFGGTSLEFFSQGLELGNQVYMQYVYNGSSYSELKVKVLDMGQGHERIPWFTNGNPTSYETTFPTVLSYLQKQTSIKPDKDLQKDFVSHSAILNADEYNLQDSWKKLSSLLSISEKELKEKFLPLSAVYSIADHSRATLFALNDSALPSNVGGGYNLRTLIRRMLSLSQEYSFSIDYEKLFELHSSFLKPLYPNLYENKEDILKIFNNEFQKFTDSQKRAQSILSKSLSQSLSTEKLLELYDSNGISPELIKKEAQKKNIKVNIPDNFYSLLEKRHSTPQIKEEKVKIPIKETDTKPLFWKDWKLTSFKAKVQEIKDNYIILDSTAFYPTSGGQEFDKGTLNNQEVIDVIKQGNTIIHLLSSKPNFKQGDIVQGEINFPRRKSLTQHHTGAHLINLAAREVLGSHIWQAGAYKSQDKARLDITHYTAITQEQEKQIESLANSYIQKNLPVKTEILPREEAEKKYGMRIYQGGFIPGRNLRIVNIGNKEIEACGGTHVLNTKEIESIKIISINKIQDAIVRITFVCGSIAQKTSETQSNLLQEISNLLQTPENQLVSATEILFKNWKLKRKGKQPIKEDSKKDSLSQTEQLEKISKQLKTQPQHIIKTISRMLKDLKS